MTICTPGIFDQRLVQVAHAFVSFRERHAVAVAVQQILAQPIALVAVDADDGDGGAVGGLAAAHRRVDSDVDVAQARARPVGAQPARGEGVLLAGEGILEKLRRDDAALLALHLLPPPLREEHRVAVQRAGVGRGIDAGRRDLVLEDEGIGVREMVARADEPLPRPLGVAEGKRQLHLLGGLLHLVGVGDVALVDRVVVDQQREVLSRWQSIDEAVSFNGCFLGIARPLDGDAVCL